MTQKNKKLIILICSIFLGGLLSGLIFQTLIFPYLLVNPYFSKFQFVKNFKEGKIIINTKEEIIVQESVVLEKAIAQIEKAVVGVQTKTSEKTISGSGLIIASDGLVITLAELVPAGGSFSVFIDGEKIKPQILKRDLENNLALLKIEKTNLKTCGFSAPEKIKLGVRVFLLGINPPTLNPIVNEGIVKYFDENNIKTNIFESSSLKGSPLFNIEGDLVGLNTIDSAGKVIAIPVQKIKDFSGL